jgi:hypothetical protein
MEAIESDHECTDSRWLSQEPRFRKGVFLEQSVFECSDKFLLFFIVSIERAEVEVG